MAKLNLSGKVKSFNESTFFMCIGIVTIFSWAEPDQRLHRFEFHYFLDSLFRGLLGLIVLKGNKMPEKRGVMVNAEEIERIVCQVYGENEFLDKEALPKTFLEVKELLTMFGFFARNLQGAVKLQKKRNWDKLQRNAQLRMMKAWMPTFIRDVLIKGAVEKSEGQKIQTGTKK